MLPKYSSNYYILLPVSAWAMAVFEYVYIVLLAVGRSSCSRWSVFMR